jgi:hypothetical protein
VFERSAEPAGFFEHGKNRLVTPGVAVGQQRKNDQKPPGSTGNGGNGGGGPSDTLIQALIEASFGKALVR